MDTGLMAPIRAWLKRAEKLLEGHAETPIHAWLAVVRNYERLLSGDFASAREWARRAIDIGSRMEPAAATMGQIAEARSLIFEGKVREGLSLMDEASLTIVSDALDPISTGMVYCELLCGFQAVAQYDLAEQWTEAMERWHPGQPVGSLHGRCRVHKAEVLRIRGRLREAEEAALAACSELRPYLRREFGWPLTELGRIRFRLGDLKGAEEAFLAAHEVGWDPQPGLAIVRLAQGDTSSAVASIRYALEHPLSVPSKEWPPNTELRRAPLLDAATDIEIAAGNLEAARRAADELQRIAAAFESRALTANAMLARGKVLLAEGDASRAEQDIELALDGWNELGAPYEAALARLALGKAHRVLGNERKAEQELSAALSSFQRLGASYQASTATRALEGHEKVPELQREEPVTMSTTAKAAENLFLNEGDFWSLSFDDRLVRLQNLKGLHYLARLLESPGRELHVVNMVIADAKVDLRMVGSDPSGVSLQMEGGVGELLDAEAMQAYRRRLAEIEEDIEDATAFGDRERVTQANEERDFLVRELARAVGLGGRSRTAASPSERARASVTRAIRQAMARISRHHPSLGAHLEFSIRTGTFCSYCPDPRQTIEWHV
jgi:tetratricopeptide (TPR) repeat protein